jgi:hypothetical protein
VEQKSAFEKIAGHPALPLFVGAGLSLDTSGDLIVRSYILLFLAIWMAVDVCLWISKVSLIVHRKDFRPAACGLSLSLIGCLLLAPIEYLETKKASEQQEEVFMHLLVPTPTMESNLEDIGISIRNDSRSDVDVRSLTCEVVAAVFEGGMSVDGMNQIHAPPQGLERGGDSNTIPCLKGLYIIHAPLMCVDIKAFLAYEIVDQPGRISTKEFRHWGRQSPVGFSWKNAALNAPNNCTRR